MIARITIKATGKVFRIEPAAVGRYGGAMCRAKSGEDCALYNGPACGTGERLADKLCCHALPRNQIVFIEDTQP